jgi:nitrogen-specific signal transduction histidine kinase
VLISKVVDLKRSEADDLAQTLDGLHDAVILVDATGQIVHANAAARGLLFDGDVMRSAEGRLVVSARQAG